MAELYSPGWLIRAPTMAFDNWPVELLVALTSQDRLQTAPYGNDNQEPYLNSLNLMDHHEPS